MAKKKTDPESATSAGERSLRVHTEGAQDIHASDSKFSLDAKPDPYVVFVLNDMTHKCDHVNDVELIKYVAWPNVVKDFEITQEKMLTDLSLVVHVKDSDTIKDRYIGGTAIPLGPLYAAMQKNALCQSKMSTLEFAGEKFKKKKDSGKVKLTITLVEDKPPTGICSASIDLECRGCGNSATKTASSSRSGETRSSLSELDSVGSASGASKD